MFPACGENVIGALHARRAGWVSAQQYGVCLMNSAKALGVTFISGTRRGAQHAPLETRAC